MDTQTLILLNTLAVTLAAIALGAQAVFTILKFRLLRQLRDKVDEILPQARSVIENADKAMSECRQQILEVAALVRDVSTKAHEVLDLSKAQLTRVDGLLADATDRAKVQLERMDLVFSDTIERLHETLTVVHNGIMRPVREVQGVAAGIQAMLSALFRGNRPTVAEATHDEEMFI
jgi:hypothetical protein